MTFNQKNPGEALEPELEEALRAFRSNVHAWSEAAYSRPRTVAQVARGGSWRLALGWALAVVLTAGGVSGSLYERHHRQQMEKIAAAERAARQQQLAAERQQEQQAASQGVEDNASLLAAVDNDISQGVPQAMEPLAQLMDEGANSASSSSNTNE